MRKLTLIATAVATIVSSGAMASQSVQPDELHSVSIIDANGNGHVTSTMSSDKMHHVMNINAMHNDGTKVVDHGVVVLGEVNPIDTPVLQGQSAPVAVPKMVAVPVATPSLAPTLEPQLAKTPMLTPVATPQPMPQAVPQPTPEAQVNPNPRETVSGYSATPTKTYSEITGYSTKAVVTGTQGESISGQALPPAQTKRTYTANAKHIDNNTYAIKSNSAKVAQNSDDIAQNTSDIKDLRADLERQTKVMDGAMAQGIATSSLVMPYNVGKFSTTVALGHSGEANAIAGGVGMRFTESFTARANVAYDDGSENVSIGAGMGYEW